ncbi:hypothetical protein LJR039_006951 [Pseudorhodoferax sp. LjRoot39]
MDSGSITLGHRESSFGFSYNDGSGKPVGYSIVDRVVGGMMQSGEMETLPAVVHGPDPAQGREHQLPLNAETREAFANPSSKGI